MQCQRRLKISRVKNIGIVLEQSGMAFRLAPPDGGLVVVVAAAESPLKIDFSLPPCIRIWGFGVAD